MSDTPINVAYTKRFNAVLAYIDEHLEDDLSVKTLSHVANFSTFHFHRQFTAFVGVPVSRYVQLMRLRRAAHRLAAVADHSVLEAALGAGFDSPEAFCRAFKRAVGMTPSAFRKAPNWQVWHAVFTIPHFSRTIIMQVRIVEFPEVRVAALEHCGPPGLVNESVSRFIEWRMQSGQSPVASSRSFGIPYGNPDTTPAEAFRFAICGEIHEAVEPNAFGVRELVIAGGRCVVVRHVGSPDHIGESIYPIYRDWLPTSGEELRDQLLFFHYLSVYPQTPQDQWKTDVYVPLQ
ncbi:AraC family transcriptional regulator [Pseudomonas fluorescens group sp.]|uniref:Possible AraC-family transcriptional regulator n=2 Tax=Pseudomonas fluorescens TaxID=294 RepID=C3JY18_PSEFS|nr:MULTISPECIES: AraC family transcriptional regulator [Pseudomonas fluorescens group]MBZ6459075.1 AraC family transcriptional regulator [Pseudomonas fluorescens group sp.]MBZ6461564.1 AraC family transcriptional regulator [Pseudomonas fluorescens group sp.]MBZ6471289.1 AraC family transcriptional regulator [Pseudomonas fluorescens group sp.]WQD70105.1 AraC family transcriptional regulator [Pseudomonas marginalis]CAI2797959.1 Possible AraC-family transcriptional regulator [Pseudomonas fluoresc